MDSISYSNVIAVNELMKSVVTTSRRVNLAALNAMLLSRKGGGQTIGFATVTKELRKFTLSLELQMQRLSSSLSRLIYDLSSSKKIEHRYKLIQKALSGSNFAQDDLCLKLINQRLDKRNGQLSIEISSATGKVFQEIEKSALTCDLGQNLAVLAKIESQSGGEYQHALMNVANAIETIITSIDTQLKQAKHFIQNEHFARKQ